MTTLNPSPNSSDYLVALRAAARSLGIQSSYINNEGQVVKAPMQTLAKLCECLIGINPQNKTECLAILDKRQQQLLTENMPSSIVAWGGFLNNFYLQLDPNSDSKNIEFKLNGKNLNYKTITVLKRKNRQTYQIQITDTVPEGYHELEFFIDNQKKASSFIISAPEKIEIKNPRSWGPFLPTYALRSESDWGIGSVSELKMAVDICKKYGAKFVSVLPTLAGRFEDHDCDPSPYSSLSRFFWNEIYLDVDKLLKKYPAPAAVQLRNSSEFKNKISELRSTDYVDYFKCYELKKQVLKILSENFFNNPLPTEYMDFIEKNPLTQQYALFRSPDKKDYNYHLFVQYEIDLAIQEIQKNSGISLYMDYPVGVNDSGFDYSYEPDNFLGTVSVGAPPEPVFQLGQDWGFPAFHPQNLAKKKYKYFIDSLRHHFKYAKILRLDHIIGLYRIYSVPKGFGGKNGAYLRFNKNDFFAILVLEATRANADIIGENLGTVPPQVNEILNKRHLKGMEILQLDLWQNPEDLLLKIDQNTLCALNTHDMPMFSRFLKGDDLDEVRDLGILHADFYSAFKKERQLQVEKWQKIFQENPTINAINFIAKSNCKYLVINVEDLWLEERPQNIPGTWKEVPNWRRKMQIPLEKWEENTNLTTSFKSLKELMK